MPVHLCPVFHPSRGYWKAVAPRFGNMHGLSCLNRSLPGFYILLQGGSEATCLPRLRLDNALYALTPGHRRCMQFERTFVVSGVTR